MSFRFPLSRSHILTYVKRNPSPITVSSRTILGGLDPDMAAHRTLGAGLSDRGFFVNNTEIDGSVLLLPRSFLMWSPKSYDEMTVESLDILSLLVPKIEVLVIGTGSEARRPCPKFMKHFTDQGIKVEQMTSVRN